MRRASQSHTHHAWVRSTALFSLLFLLLASGRGLLPEICANLSAPVEIQGAAGISQSQLLPARSCCAPRSAPADCGEQGNSRRPAPLPPLKDCPFCNLVSAPAESLEIAFYLPPAHPEPAPFLLPFLARSEHTLPFSRLRAPPLPA